MLNKDINSLVFSYLNFTDRYKYGLTSRTVWTYWNNFCHPEVIKLTPKQIGLEKKYKNIKFAIDFYIEHDYDDEIILTIDDASCLSDFYKVDLSFTLINDGFQGLDKLDSVCELDLSCNDIQNIDRFKNSKKLYLNQTLVKDVSQLNNIHTLDISNTDVCDISMLKNLYSINYFRNIK